MPSSLAAAESVPLLRAKAIWITSRSALSRAARRSRVKHITETGPTRSRSRRSCGASAMTTARFMRFSNSRTLPGQVWAEIAAAPPAR